MYRSTSALLVTPLAVGMLIGAAAAPLARPSQTPARPTPLAPVATRAQHVTLAAPAAPPNGTYVYELSRNGTVQGKTTVVVLRRNELATIDTAEAGDIGAAHAHVLASYRYRDLNAASYVETFQAPFLRRWQENVLAKPHEHNDFYDQTTLRYRSDSEHVFVDIDGEPDSGDFAMRSHDRPIAPWVFDAPFMTGALLLPAFQHRSHDDELEPLSGAFGLLGTLRKQRLESGTPQFLKTPKNDRLLAVAGLANVWFDPGNFIVHEAHFTSLNIDARLVSYSRALEPAAFAPAPPPAPRPKLESTEISIEGDGVTLAGTLSRPKSAKKTPAVVLVPPGPHASRNFGSDGPNPTFVDLAFALVARGYAVVRYDTRGVGKSGGSSAAQTWDASLADADAAVRFAQSAEGIDATHVYALGYGNGADLAFAIASLPDASESLAGVVALAPTTATYRECVNRNGLAMADRIFRSEGLKLPNPVALRAWIEKGSRGDASPGSELWLRSLYAHDPVSLADRAKAPALIFHPGVARCGETSDETASYDERLHAANPRATIIAASDLSARFGGRYDADSLANTEAIFPFRFDASTASAIADWLDSPKTASAARARSGGSNAPAAPRGTPPPPPSLGSGGAASGMPNPHAATPRPRPTDVTPGQLTVPSTFGATASPATPVPAVAPAASPVPKAS